MYRYTITYSVGTSEYDERRFSIRGIPDVELATRITSMQAKNKTIYSIQREGSY